MNPRFLSRGLSWPLLLWQSEQRRRPKGKGEQSACRWKGYSANPGRQHQLWDAAGRRRLEGEVTHLKNSPPHLSGLILKKLECRLTEGWPPQSRERILVSNFGCWKLESNSAWPNHICAGYGATCECMVQSAIVILQETARWLSPMFDHIGDTFLANSIFLPRLPSAGGVYSPGYAFADTTLVSRFTSSFHAMNVAVDMCPNIENCTLQKDLWKMGKSQHPCCYFSFSSGWTKRTWHSHLW